MANVDLGRYKRLVSYFWDPEPKNDEDSRQPIWCLGCRYAPFKLSLDEGSASLGRTYSGSFVTTEPLSGESHTVDRGSAGVERRYIETSVNGEPDRGWPSAFLDDFESRLWMTYRSGFPAIAKSQNQKASSNLTFAVRMRSQLVDKEGFTSDAGFGCMIRSGQAVLANALIILRLGREWRCTPSSTSESAILALFADDPRAPFSVHRFVTHGAIACGTHPGEWFGPSATARCIQALANEHPTTGLRVYMTGDGSDVYEDAFMRVAKPTRQSLFSPTIVLVGIRLGIDRVNPVYWEALKSSLQMSQSLGIAGGRPSSSHYFIGVQGSKFFYLDPHHTRPALPYHSDCSDYDLQDIASCHTRRLRRLDITEMDPSMLIAFIIRDEEDWRDWRSQISRSAGQELSSKENYGKAVIRVANQEPPSRTERAAALDEVEFLSDGDDDEDADGVKVDGSEGESIQVDAVDDGDGIKVDLLHCHLSRNEPSDEDDGVKVDLERSDSSRYELLDATDGVKI